MANFNDMFPSRYFKAEDLRGANGRGFREVKVRINDIVQEGMGGEDDEQKWVLHFEGQQKGLVLNRTNGQTIADALGGDTERWLGQEIVLFVMTVNTPQGQKPGIRVRVPEAVTA